jgi:hypothetical protein
MLEVMQSVRRKNMAELVPKEMKKRNDFVLGVEMQETTELIGKKVGLDLSEFFNYYTSKAKGKTPP